MNKEKIFKLINTPIGKNIFANVFRVAVVFTNQIFLVPMYLIFWGTELYGDWIILSALTSFFTMSDLGLNNVTSNRFCIKFAEGDRSECKSLLFNNFVLVVGIGILATLAIFVVGLFWDYSNLLNLRTIKGIEATWILTILTIQVFISMSSSIMDAIYNCNHLAAKATYLNNICRLANALLILFGIICHLSILKICIIAIVPWIVLFAYKKYETKKIFKEQLSISDWNFKLFKEVVKPSIVYMGFPMGNIVIFQGFTFLVNAYFGATILVLFNTTRTLVNFVRTVIQIITSGVKPEFSLAYGRKDVRFMNSVFKKGLMSCFSLAVFISLLLLICGPWIYEVWTHGKMEFSYTLMVSFFVAMIFNSIWEACGIVLMSTNNHIGMGVVYIFSTLLSLIIGYIFAASLGNLNLVALSIGISDILMVSFSYKKAKSIIGKFIKV